LVTTRFAQSLTLDSTRIEVEPSTLEGRRRNDIRVHGSAATRRTTIDYDIKVVSLVSHHAHSTTTRLPTGTSTFEHAQSQANRYLESVGKAADIRRPWALSEFRALVFSAGGLMEKETAAELDRWKPDLGEATFDRMTTRMSLALLRARAKTFDVVSARQDSAVRVIGFSSLASRSPAFLDFLTLLTASVSAGTAPGRSMLCTSRLTPLAKTDGGIRPIACGELIYRLITKTLLRKAFKPDFLEKYQLGVSSKGGVEPIVRTIERALAGTLDQRYTHLTSVDATNAFNAMYRKVIATATKRFAPALYRPAKWAYNDKSDLVVSTHAVLESSQGVRQGDPLGPLLFSLGLSDAARCGRSRPTG